MFSGLVGNDSVKHRLRHLLASGRLPNSLLFAGDDGVGKRQFALAIAKSFVCKEPVKGEACGVCAACRRAGTFVFPKPDNKDGHEVVIFSEHTDVGIVIPYNRNILVKAVRHLESEANFRPNEARARFFIIDNADKMNDSASNALLKTLEEPAPTSYLFLITSRPDALLTTIRSRCQTLRFAPVETDAMERFLIDDRAFSHDEARLAARLSRGSIRRALSVDVDKFREQRTRMLSVVRSALLTGESAAMLRISEEMNDAKNKDRFEENLDILESVIHDIWTVRVGGDLQQIVNNDIALGISELAESADSDRLALWLADIETIRRNLAVNINRRVATDALFTAMAANR